MFLRMKFSLLVTKSTATEADDVMAMSSELFELALQTYISNQNTQTAGVTFERRVLKRQELKTQLSCIMGNVGLCVFEALTHTMLLKGRRS